MIKQLITQLTRIATALELANDHAAVTHAIEQEKNKLSREVLELQQEMLKTEHERTVVHVRPDIGEITKEVSKELAKQVRAHGGVRMSSKTTESRDV